jgi:hypothetical protein
MRPFLLRLLPVALLLAAATAVAAPVKFPMPDGSVIERDERDIAPFLGAWKAARAAQAARVARPMTANQALYDVRWYDLALTFTPATSQVSGTVTMRATVVGGPISSVDLDLYSLMSVDAVTAGSVTTSFSRIGDVLTVQLDHAYTTGQTFTTTVTYHGNPTAPGYFGFPVANGRQLIWSLSEAYGARTWWPCKDANEDKADSVDVHFTVPLGSTTASNGTLLSTTTTATTSTTNWRERYPIAPYLVSIASYPYTVVDDWYRPTPTDSMLIRFHLFPETVASAAAVDAKVKTMIAAYATRFGEYPFLKEKYGHAQFLFSGGMEHQTCTSLGSFSEFVVAHELGHQWWGDMVTCRDFHHIWLNEGFATYCEALWDEANGGTPAYMANILGNTYLGAGSIYVPDATNETRVFDSNLSYDKASWVLHMLRHMLGDSTFFAAMRQYRAQWAYKSAVTEDFRDVCEVVSGRDLHAFFQQWISGEYHPIYRAEWTSAPAAGGYDVNVTLRQTQSWQLFTMPVDLRITTAAGTVNITVPDSLAAQTFTIHVAALPSAVAVDPDNGILKELDQPFVAPPFDRSVLLVNGVDWANYGAEITSAYSHNAFSGAYAIDFWDTFNAPAAGYPLPLPAPLGHGAVTSDVLGHYRNVIWVGNNFNGDLGAWQATPIRNYLKAGGNLLLMSRMGDSFLDDSLRTYLGITWTNTGATLNDCLTTRPGFTSMAPISAQSVCALFDTVRTTSESELIFRASSGFTPSRGLGAIRMPVGGAGLRPHGGRFAFLSGRPYRWTQSTLQANVTNLLTTRFLEPVSLVGTPAPVLPARLALAAPQPNPSRGATTLHFSLPRDGRTQLVLLDLAGRRTRVLIDAALAAGAHEVEWDGRDASGTLAAPGLYWARLECEGERVTRRLVRVR